MTAKALIAHCHENLTGYKVPHQIEFRDELPKSNVGKILRRQLREEEMKKRAAERPRALRERQQFLRSQLAASAAATRLAMCASASST